MVMLKKKLWGLVLGMSTLLLLGCNGINEEQTLLRKAQELGYIMELNEDSRFSIQKDDANFKFEIGFDKTSLIQIKKTISPSSNIQVINDIGTVTLKILKEDQVEVTLEDTVEANLAGGKTMELPETRTMICGTDFSVESIDQESTEAFMGKAEKNYSIITENWLSADQLKELYDEGKEIEKALVK